MATYQWTRNHTTLGSAATFQAACGDVVAGLAAIGLVQTADTGQTDAATIALPAGGNLYTGYQIWRFNDALQATAPVFIRIAFGSASIGSTLRLAITVGKETDGAGNVVSLVYKTLAPTAAPIGTTHIIAGDSGRLNIGIGFNSASKLGAILCVERLLDVTGTPTAEGVSVMYFTDNASTAGYMLNAVFYYSGNQPPTTNRSGLMATSTGAWGDTGTIYLAPCFPVGWGVKNQCTGCVLYFHGDIGVNTPFPVSMYGVTHYYYPVGTSTICNAEGGPVLAVNTVSVAMRKD